MAENYLKTNKKYESLLSVANENGYDTVSDFICDKYNNEGWSSVKISKVLDFYPNGVLNALKRKGLQVRGRKTTIETVFPSDSYDEIDSKIFSKKNAPMFEIARKKGFSSLSQCICKLYFDQKFTTIEIADLFKTSPSWVASALKKMLKSPRKKGGCVYQKIDDEMKAKILEAFKEIEPSWRNIHQYCVENDIAASPKTIQRFLKKAMLTF
jgi:hypothetical protein